MGVLTCTPTTSGAGVDWKAATETQSTLPPLPTGSGTMNITLNNGVAMPTLGLGVFQSAPEETTAAVEAALATGYRHIDTAAAYGNEREVGEGIAKSGVDQVFLETKIWINDYGYAETLHGFDKSAGKLGV